MQHGVGEDSKRFGRGQDGGPVGLSEEELAVSVGQEKHRLTAFSPDDRRHMLRWGCTLVYEAPHLAKHYSPRKTCFEEM